METKDKDFILNYSTEDRLYGLLDGRGYALRISQHCKKNRDIECFSKKRTIEQMHIGRLHHVVLSLTDKMPDEGKYVIIIKDDKEVDIYHHILVAVNKYDFSGEATRYTIITMLTNNTEDMVFKKINFLNRIYYKSTLKEILAISKLMTAEEIFESRRHSMYVPGLLEKRTGGLKIAQKRSAA